MAEVTRITNGKDISLFSVTGASLVPDANFPVSDSNQSGFNVRRQNWVSVHYVWTGGSHSDATITLQESNDRVNWVTLTSAATLGATSGDAIIKSTAVACQYVRVAFVGGANTTGLLNLYAIAKRS